MQKNKAKQSKTKQNKAKQPLAFKVYNLEAGTKTGVQNKKMGDIMREAKLTEYKRCERVSSTEFVMTFSHSIANKSNIPVYMNMKEVFLV